MKIITTLLLTLSAANAFAPAANNAQLASKSSALEASARNNGNVETSRQNFLKTVALASGVAVGFTAVEPASATGRATLEVTYRRYAPRIRAGGEFYGGEFKQLVKNNDWAGIKNALREVPEKTKKDANKQDAGVAARARQAGGFSDDRVLVAGK